MMKSKQTLLVIIIRGPPASGKSTTGKRLRNKLDQKTAHIQVDFLKRMISKEITKESRDMSHESAQILTDVFLKKGWNVVIEELFIYNEYIGGVVKIAEGLGCKVFIFELTAPLEVLIQRDASKNYGVIGGIKWLRKLYKLISENPEPRAIKIDTSKNSIDETVNIILTEINNKL